MQKREWALAFVASVLFILATTYPAQTAGFHWTDDHLIARYLNGEPGHGEAIFETDRFRPLFWLTRVTLLYPLFRDNAALWHGYILLFSALWLTLLYAVLRKRGLPPAYALIGWFVPLLYPQATAVFYRIGYWESIGCALVLGAIYARQHGHGWLMVVLLIAAGCWKESFALTLPAFILWTWRRDTAQTIVLSAVFAFLAAVMVMARNVTGGQSDIVTGGFGAWRENILWLLIPVGFGLPLVALAVRRWNARYALLLAVWVAPQLLIHGLGLKERYLYPAILASCLALPFAFYAYRHARVMQLVMALSIAVGAALFWRSPYMDALRYRDEAVTFHAEMRAIAADNPQTVTIQLDAVNPVEYAVSAGTWLRWYGYTGEIEYGGL
jgi:hypothetical protein